ncbi:MAG: HEAT repeat domain-containing protein [Deltaproteobacteria bacterium]|nr:HEAT repeat domain-containing protein [Deltaproteobacteria bacterium]
MRGSFTTLLIFCFSIILPCQAMAQATDSKRSALGKDKIAARVEFLASELLTSDSFKVRLQAANILGQLKDPMGVKPLIIALGDEHFAVRGQAAIGLGAIGDPSAVPDLINILKHDEEPWVRKEAARALGHLNHKDTVPALIDALKDKRWKVRLAAAQSLGMVGNEKAVNALVAVLDNALEAEKVRDAAMRSLVMLRDYIDAGTQVLTLKRDPDRNKRSRSARLLGIVGGPLAVDALLDGLNDKDTAVKLAVIETLEKIGDTQAIEPLETVLRHEKDQLVSRRIKNCLKILKMHLPQRNE